MVDSPRLLRSPRVASVRWARHVSWTATNILCVAVALAAGCGRDGSGRLSSTPPADRAGDDAIFAASELPEPLDVPLPGDGMGVTIHRLSNGMTVYISTDREKPTISAWVAVRTGGRNDPPNSTGLAHYLEHMLFKGTDELGTLDIAAEQVHLDKIAALYEALSQTDDVSARAQIFAEIDAETQATAKTAIPGEMSRLYSALGIDSVNAFTTMDATVYIAEVPSPRFRAWATVEGERFADARFRLFYPELEAVYEEKNRAIDSPYRAIHERTLRGLFPGHPYGTQSVLGTVEHLKTPAYADMNAYFERWYVPNNMAVVLAGDIDAATAVPILEEAFGRLRPSALTAPEPGRADGPTGRVLSELEAEGEQSLSIAWRTVPIGHADEPVLAVLDWVMDNATSGLLNRELTLNQRVPRAGSSVSMMREGGYWSISATARDGQALEEVEAMVMEVVAKLKAGEFSQEIIDAIILHEEIREKSALEEPWSRVARMCDAFVSRRPWQDVLSRPARVRAVTKADVVAAARRYITDDRVVVYRREGKPDLPKITTPVITPIEIDPSRKSPFFTRVAGMPATPLEPEWLAEGKHFSRHALPSGVLIHAKNPRNDLYAISVEIERGLVDDRLLCHAIEVLEKSGTSSLGPAEVRERLYALGSSVSFYCGDESTTISISGIDRTMEPTLALVSAWVRDANLTRETTEGAKALAVSQRKDMLEDPDVLPWLLVDWAQWAGRASAVLAPSNAQLRAAKAPELQRKIRVLLDDEQEVRYFGPREAEGVKAVLTLGSARRRSPSRPPRVQRTIASTTIYLLDKEVAKASVTVVVPWGPRPHEEVASAELIGEYLSGGMGGLIFSEIREARGLAYFAAGDFSTGGRRGDHWALEGRMQTQVEKTTGALALLIDLLRRPIDPTRLSEAKEAREQSFRAARISPRWITGYVSHWIDRGYASDPRPAIWTKTRALDPQQLDAYLAPVAKTPMIIAITADKKRLDMVALAKLGKIVEVTPAQLTSWGAFRGTK